ncbi:MAG TPA: right-handed parallel beta-helix repeat-containing protein [Candidatus Polarisedimenticolia bacterium]|nr:right-handed parallel beta-helix repeat-containing protein [Candidatus Polarisedimenticolia bacterium]
MAGRGSSWQSRRTIRLVLAAAACGPLAWESPHAAGTFYVDRNNPSCSDAGPGTQQTPYCAIGAAVSAQGGPSTTLIVAPAVYREQVAVNKSGAAGAPLVLRAEGSGVVVDGADDFSDPDLWDGHAGDAWQASSVSWTPKQVIVDGLRLVASTEPPATLSPGTFRAVAGEGLYVNIGGDNPGDHQAYVGRRNHGFRIASRSWIEVSGFTVARTEDNGIYLLGSSTDVLIAGNTVIHANFSGISVNSCSRVTVSGNMVADSNRNGIYLLNGTTQSVVESNEVARSIRPDGAGINGIRVEEAPGTIVRGNLSHHNQDTGIQINESDDVTSLQNISWANGDHGFDHLQSLRALHVGDVAWSNLRDGFSFEAGSTEGRLYDSIGANNGVATNHYNLFVDGASAAGFASESNLFWNLTAQPPIRIVGAIYATVQAYAAATGQDMQGLQADPLFVDPGAGDFRLRPGSPAIDSADSSVPAWPATDARGGPRVDDPDTPNTGAGGVAFADRGALEYLSDCNGGAGPELEVCDAADNDCDGSIDEDFAVGEACTVGLGACQVTGHTFCAPDGLGPLCDAVPGPPAPEVCDGVDNDCDGVSDNPDPPGPAAVDVTGPAGLVWDALPGATFYQAVRGDLAVLLASVADFTLATTACLGPELVVTSLSDPLVPPVGGAFWYLVRGANCGGSGTYDSGSASQQGSRDAGIAASPQSCP